MGCAKPIRKGWFDVRNAPATMSGGRCGSRRVECARSPVIKGLGSALTRRVLGEDPEVLRCSSVLYRFQFRCTSVSPRLHTLGSPASTTAPLPRLLPARLPAFQPAGKLHPSPLDGCPTPIRLKAAASPRSWQAGFPFSNPQPRRYDYSWPWCGSSLTATACCTTGRNWRLGVRRIRQPLATHSSGGLLCTKTRPGHQSQSSLTARGCPPAGQRLQIRRH